MFIVSQALALGHMDEVKRLIAESEEKVTEQSEEKVIEQPKEKLLTCEVAGWRPIHYAAAFGFYDTFVMLAEKLTDDGKNSKI